MAKQSSSESDSQQSRLLQTKPDKLKVGMYVDLNCSWVKHPFASKTFKITSENELAIIRGLGLSAVLVDPALSDSETAELCTADDSDTVKGGAAIPSNASVQVRSSSDSALSHPTITRYKESLQQADAVYKETLAQSMKALNDVRAGSEAGLMAAKEMVNRLTD